MLGHVVSNVVGQNDNASLTLADVVLLDVVQGAVHRSARGASAHNSFFSNKSSRHNIAWFVVSVHPFGDKLAISNPRDEVIANSFDLLSTLWSIDVHAVRLGEEGTWGVDGNDLDIRVELFKAARDARQGSSSTGS